MIGIPQTLGTKRDWMNAFDVAKKDSAVAPAFIFRLTALRNNRQIKTLKASSSGKPADQQTAADYELTDDPAAEIFRLGFTVSEVDKMIKELS